MSNDGLKRAMKGEAPPAAGEPRAPGRKLTVVDWLENPRVRDGLAAVASKYLPADRMLRLAINSIKRTPRLLECDPQSVLGAVMASTALGLEPNTPQQQAFLIPYARNVKRGDSWVKEYECQFQIGARGFVTLAYRSPEIGSLYSEAIRAGDHFEHELGSKSFLSYRKSLRNRGDLVGSFCYVRLTNGTELACVLPLEEIEKIRAKSESFRSVTAELAAAKASGDRKRLERAQRNHDETPWLMWADDMAAKSATKKHAKQLPIAASDLLQTASDLDDKADTGALNLRALADPDIARGIIEQHEAPPTVALTHSPADPLEFEDDERDLQMQVRQADERGDEAMRRAHAAEAQVEQMQAGGKARGRARSANVEVVRELEPGDAPQDESQQADAGADSPAGVLTPDGPSPKTLAKYRAGISQAPSSEHAALELDQARSARAQGALTDTDIESLTALYHETWAPPAGKGAKK